ncbi:MAG TPA: NADH:flavin oxidoreductase [Pelotomaculum sp.]|nr:NADH:flavin oxidoreductase [Pelotomaculum sp.]
MSKVFGRTEINGMVLENRFVRSATWEGLAGNDGAVTPELMATMVALARGGAGLIITGHAYVCPEGKAGPRQLGIYKDELVPGLKEMTTAIHSCGGKVVAQLSHAGRFAPEKLIGRAPLVVSADEESGKTLYHEMTGQDIQEIVTAFADAARRAKFAGFDGVQIHAAHGYLLSQFLSPVFNRRQDAYGGEIHNRSRMHIEVFQAVREAVGKDYPVLIKLNCRDFVENGLSLDDSLQVARALSDAGLDAIELSGGLLTGGQLSPIRPGIKSEEEEAYYRDEARYFKNAIRIPLILVGGIRSFQTAERLVEDGAADYISLCRPLIREPNLINRWKSGDRCKSECRSDNRCFVKGLKGNGIYCEMRNK